MGASDWAYTVPYEKDVEGAFHKLKEQVFERGEYYSSDRKKKHKSIEALVEAQAEEGTHSILDMEWVSKEAAPAPDARDFQAELAALFLGGSYEGPIGTIFALSKEEARVFDKSGVLRAAPDDPAKVRMETGTGRYAVIHEGDFPRWLWFGGVSGD